MATAIKNFINFVEWFKDFEVDTECNLIYVTDNLISECRVVSPKTVSWPLIHAYEDNELWILNTICVIIVNFVLV